MYFGVGGTDAIPRAVHYVAEQILSLAPVRCNGPLTVSIAGDGKISIRLGGMPSSVFKPANVEHWIKELSNTRMWMIGSAAGYSEEFVLESSDGKRRARLRWSDKQGARMSASSVHDEPFLRISLSPIYTRPKGLTHDQLYNIAARIKELSFLKPGLITSVRADCLAGELRYFYPQGLRSFLFEEDYSRWSLHRGCLSFKGKAESMSVEGHLRFLHAGVPHMRSYVNFHPTHGGSHVEGLGYALSELFPDSSQGCREVAFITNPDTGAHVKLPHTFIGALRVRLDDPHYRGPTKDILDQDEVRDFVHAAARKQLKPQWEKLRKERR